MTWTTTPPDRPGWWWMKEPGERDCVVRLIRDPHSPVRLYTSGLGEYVDEMPVGTRWAGPIQMPQESEGDR